MDARTMRFKRKRLVILSLCSLIVGALFLLGSNLVGLFYFPGVIFIGVGVGLATIALIFPILARISEWEADRGSPGRKPSSRDGRG